MTPKADSVDPRYARARLQRLGNLIANLAHPKDDHCENPFEDEAHDIIRELLDLVDAQAARLEAERARATRLEVLVKAAYQEAFAHAQDLALATTADDDDIEPHWQQSLVRATLAAGETR